MDFGLSPAVDLDHGDACSPHSDHLIKIWKSKYRGAAACYC